MQLLWALLCASVGLYLMYRTGKRRFERNHRNTTFKQHNLELAANALHDVAWKAGIALVIVGGVLSL